MLIRGPGGKQDACLRCPMADLRLDEDGDLVVERRTAVTDDLVLSEVHLESAPGSSAVTTFTCSGQVLTVHHGLATPLASVGLQVWRGALLLGDYILHLRHCFTGSTVVELGAGPGVAGLLAARFAEDVILSDVNPSTLDNCQANVVRNPGSARVRVRHLDWTQSPDWLAVDNTGQQPTAGLPCLPGKAGLGPGEAAAVGGLPQAGQQSAQRQQEEGAVSPMDAQPRQLQLPMPWGRDSRPAPSVQPQPSAAGQGCCEWQAGDLAVLPRLGYILAADCIYDNHLTEALMRTAVQLMRLSQQHRQQKQQQQQQQQEMHEHPREFAEAPGGARLGRAPARSSTTSSALMPPGPVLLVALEKRIVFTLHDLDVRAPAYDFWRTLFVEAVPGSRPLHDGVNAREGPGSSTRALPASSSNGRLSCGQAAPPAAGPAGAAQEEQWCVEQLGREAPFALLGRRVDVGSIPQLIQEYERGQYLELWELWLADHR